MKMLFLKRLGWFLKLKWQETFGSISIHWKNIAMPLYIYLGLQLTFGGCYMAEKHLGWTCQYNVVMSNQENENFSLTNDDINEETGEVIDYPIVVDVLIWVVGFPFIAAAIIFSWLIFPFILILILAIGYLMFIGSKAFWKWIVDNWRMAGLKSGICPKCKQYGGEFLYSRKECHPWEDSKCVGCTLCVELQEDDEESV
jgi:hypothetical protein